MGIAPEVIRRGKHTTRTDIWSLGVTVYEMITGKLPFVNYDAQQLLLLDIAAGTVEVNYPSDFPCHARMFIEACLAFNPEQRPSAEELLGHDFIMNPSEPESTKSTTLTEVPSDVRTGIEKAILVFVSTESLFRVFDKITATKGVSEREFDRHSG